MKNDIEKVLLSMREYLKEYRKDAGYKKKDIKQVGEILKKYYEQVAQAENNNEKILMALKNVVLSLNEINEKTDYCLIETDQREDLCEFISKVAESCGFDMSNDPTYEWREW